MFDPASLLAALKSCGITHVVWIPDTEMGQWETALRSDSDVTLIRVCREGEALAVAAGLLLGGKQPIVLIQCTGFFEAGDALRNIVHDLKLPLFLAVGVRSLAAHQKGQSTDTCPVFTEPILQAWQIPYVLFERGKHTAADLAAEYNKARAANRAGAVLLPE